MSTFKITRRRVLVSALGATAVAGGAGLWLGVRKLQGERFHNSVDRGDAFAPSVYLAILPDGEVVIWLTKSEMGQGVSTALPMLVADELDADWTRVRIEQAVAGDGFDYGQLFTAASSSVAGQWVELRRAGATAREMLVGAAADRWQVAEHECRTDNGFVIHSASGRRSGYGALAGAAARRWPSIRPRLKAPQAWRLIGTAVPRVDVPGKVRGAAIYGLDVQREGSLKAVVARPPVAGGALAHWDDTAARNVPDVVDVFPIAAGVAMVAVTTHAALRGRQALQVEWKLPPERRLSHDELAGRLRNALETRPMPVALNTGDAAARLANAADVRVADYETPYAAHACLEPMNCTAHVGPESCTVWVPSQAPESARQTAAAVAGLPLDRVVVHTTQMGGGFGRRAGQDFVAEAVAVSARLRAPVQIVWTREDDLRHGQFRPATAQRLQVALGSDGLPTAWRHQVVTATTEPPAPGEVIDTSVMGAVEDLPYAVPERRVETLGLQGPLRTTIWRAVGHVHTCFAIESMVDELALASGQDPIEYRRRMLADGPRLVACLDRAAAMADWAQPAGRHLGVSACYCMGSYVAQIVQVDVRADGSPRVVAVWCAVDCGVAVNPDSVRAQVGGGILFGLEAALFHGVQIHDGAVVNDNFDRYRMLRMSEAPAVEVEILQGADSPGGVGEIGVPGAAPALANAWFRATGKRVRSLPFVDVAAG